MDQRNTHKKNCLENTSKGFFLLLLGTAPCTVRVPKIAVNIRHRHSFASIAFFTATEKQMDNILSI